MAKRQRQYIAVYGLIYNKNGEILIIKRAAHDTFPNVWELPGGTLEFGQDPKEEVQREISEETNLFATIYQVLSIASYIEETNDTIVQAIRIAYYAKLENEAQVIQLSKDHSDYMWVSPYELKNILVSDFLLRVLEEVRK